MDSSTKICPTHPPSPYWTPSTVKVNGKSLVDFFFKQPPHYCVIGQPKCINLKVKIIPKA